MLPNQTFEQWCKNEFHVIKHISAARL